MNDGKFPLEVLNISSFPTDRLCPEKLLYNLVSTTTSASRIGPSPRNSYSKPIEKVNRFQFSTRGHE